MKKYDKGQYGYRNHHKKAETGKVAFGAAMIIVQLAARNFVDSTAWKNILTVMAILSVLPTANVASPLLAGWRYKTPSEDFHRRVAGYEGRFSILYDLIITTERHHHPGRCGHRSSGRRVSLLYSAEVRYCKSGKVFERDLCRPQAGFRREDHSR